MVILFRVGNGAAGEKRAGDKRAQAHGALEDAVVYLEALRARMAEASE